MQPLTIASGGYTLAQLNAQLRKSAGACGVRFDVNNMSGLTTLTTVTACTVEMNVDRALKGALHLTMFAEPLLRVGAMFRARIAPWFRLRMPDGGIAEWPLGVYLWSVPKRSISGSGLVTGQATQPEEWTVTLADLSHVLDLSGPGAAGFKIPAGTFTTDAMALVLAAAGFSDFTGIVGSAATVAAEMTFDLTNPQNQPVTWGAVLQILTNSVGYYSVWFDATGRPRCQPAPALATTDPSMNYTSGVDGIMLLPLNVDEQLGAIGNRVYCRAKSANGFYGVTTSDADVLFPAHPLAHVNTGVYIDQTIDDSAASTLAALQARGDKELLQRLGQYQTADLDTFAWPVHEAFDVVGVQIAGDADFNATQKYHERGWTLNPFAGTMSHKLSRIS